MKRIFKMLLAVVLFTSAFSLRAQSDDSSEGGYKFTTTKDLPATNVKDQYRSGTCWSFGGIGLMESELLRMGKGDFDLSEMYMVRQAYADKAVSYMRFHGKVNFGSGGEFHDVINMIKKYGIVPENIYDGLKYGENKHIHGEIDEVLKAFVEAVLKNEDKKLSPVWAEAFNAILDTYFGKVPEKFDYKGKSYTPQTFASETGLNPDDYVPITSFSHHPFYKKFVLELPDNWAFESINNVPLEDLWQIVVYAINNGYSVAWATDVSEKGFSWNNGVAVVPEVKIEELSGSEKVKWEKMTEKEKNEQLYSFDKPGREMTITQEIRQKALDNYQTEDEHDMLITGLAKDQNGTEYLKVKNSWSDN